MTYFFACHLSVAATHRCECERARAARALRGRSYLLSMLPCRNAQAPDGEGGRILEVGGDWGVGRVGWLVGSLRCLGGAWWFEWKITHLSSRRFVQRHAQVTAPNTTLRLREAAILQRGRCALTQARGSRRQRFAIPSAHSAVLTPPAFTTRTGETYIHGGDSSTAQR